MIFLVYDIFYMMKFFCVFKFRYGFWEFDAETNVKTEKIHHNIHNNN